MNLTSSRRRLLVTGGVLVAFVVVAVVGPWVTGYDPGRTAISQRLRPPLASDGSTTFLLGTDQLGRDLLGQIVAGARVSLWIAVCTVVFSVVLGGAIGIIAGFFGGFPDAVVMRLADIQLAFPSILLAILLAGVLGPSIANVILTLSLVTWPVFARVARATTLATRERPYVLAARALGASWFWLIWRCILPACLTPLVIMATVELGFVIIGEASLSFLGLGTPITSSSWGLTVASGRDYLTNAWWIATMPGLALAALVITIGVFGDALQHHLDPKRRA